MSTLSEPRRPRLLAQNRKLRHLQGLSLRNLSFAPANRFTADDAALHLSSDRVRTLRAPASLHSSRSSDSLRLEALRSEKPWRPPQPRKTSLNLANANPSSRQKKLDALINGSIGDVFFSLHPGADAEPIYVSEMRQRAANFNFHFFDLNNYGPEVSRTCSVTIRIWSKRPGQDDWILVLEDFVDLRQLNFIGTLLDRRFPPNALIFHLEDGIYSLDFPNRAAEPKQAVPVTTSSYNSLMKLANLESSIQDALATQDSLIEQIESIIKQTPVDATGVAQEDLSRAQKYVARQRRANHMAEQRRDELRASLRKRREAIANGRAVQAQAEEDMLSNTCKLAASRELLEQTEQQIHGQRRRICAELSNIFPITPMPDAPPLSFRICGLPLPNSTYDAATAKIIDEDTLSAALGMVALLTRHLQLYLSYPLPYPLHSYGSRSMARDDISHLEEKPPLRREFPLYLPRGGSTTGQWRFEYGWFLLNKDIEALCSSQGLRVVDIRHTLPNLKYLLYVCSAGSQDVPERKKGGVRGLWAGKLRGRVPATPPAAEGESGGSATGTPVGSIGAAKGNGVAKESDWGGHTAVDEASLPFGGDEAKFTLRTKGLRENVAR
ncbi:hypothetical protein HIM_06837 [Hirsutella minnesotensis 3608]|uniref:UV radiation resistance-associated gene protein n=1 Tax=Hirsutella minnesotensis 3608 TaxID=1043627 RepID=A0A0F8A4K1_9HYPO|nr:hypothetical protein HIM_06837 [Hirsutella minnesotensis 3608]